MNVPSSGDQLDLVSFGGHGKDGKLVCNSVICPEYNEMVVMNDGRSFQTGCGFDPLITGCCHKNKHTSRIKCFRCQDDYKTMHLSLPCSAEKLESFEFDNLDKMPSFFKDDKDRVRLCGSDHNPGGNKRDYFMSLVPNAEPKFSNRNFNSNITSNHFLCRRHKWEQGDWIDDAGFSNERGVGGDIGLRPARHIRINFNNYVRDPSNPHKWIHDTVIPGEGIFECYVHLI